MKNRQLFIAAALTASSITASAFAAPFALEGFPIKKPDNSTAYTSGGINGQVQNIPNSSYGFGNNVWNSSTANNQINTGSNSYLFYPYNSAGRFIFLGSPTPNIRQGFRTLGTYTPANTYYMSGLFAAGSGQGDPGYQRYSVMGFTSAFGATPSSADLADGGLGVKGMLWGVDNKDLVVRFSDASIAGGMSSKILLPTLTANSTYWMGFKLEVNQSGVMDRVTWWVDNSTSLNTGSEATLTSSALASGTFLADIVSTNADLVRLQQVSSNANATYFDEYAIGTSLSDIISVSYTWNVDGNGDWTTGANWAGGTAPGSIGDNVIFPGGFANSPNIALNSAVSAGSLTFNSANTYTISTTGGGSLNLQASAGQAAKITVNAGNSVIGVPVTLGSSVTNVSTASGASVSIASITDGGAGYTLNKTGLGTLSAGSINVGTLNMGNATTVGGVIKLPTDTLPRAGTPSVSVMNNLNIQNDGAGLGLNTYYGQIDVGTSDMIIRGSNAADGDTKFANVNDMAASGQYGDGVVLFSGNGITSSVAAADAVSGQLRYAVGVVRNNIDGNTLYDTFDGVSVGLNDVLVKFTYFGDADLNGIVDDSDFFLLNNGYGNSLTGWVNGDFDYSGTVDDSDFFLINNSYGLQSGGLRAGGAVPEPTGMGLIALGAGAVLGRRRR